MAKLSTKLSTKYGDPVLYLDDSEESKKVVELFREAGQPFILSEGDTGISRLPLLCWGIGFHPGLDSIKAWLKSELVD